MASTPVVPEPLKGSRTKSFFLVNTGINVPGIAAMYVAGYQWRECIPELPRLGNDQSTYFKCSVEFKFKLFRYRVEATSVCFREVSLEGVDS
ncbi:hypothetical protein D3C78_1036060 [compost metagenome]